MKNKHKFFDELENNNIFRKRFFEYHNKKHNKESFPATYLLIFILIATFIIQQLYLNSNEILINSLKTHTTALISGDYLSIITSLFLHVSLFHIISNLIALFIFGKIVEKHFGFKMIFLFLISGIIANSISSYIGHILGASYYSLGASSGIAGLIIFAILLSPLSFTYTFILPIPILLLGWLIIISDIIGLLNPTSNTNYLAHLGGYSTLLFLFFFLEIKNRKKIMLGFSINFIIILIIYIIIKIIGIEKISYLI